MPERHAGSKHLIRVLYHQHKGRYGYRRMRLALGRLGHWLNHKTVQRLMQQMGLQSRVRIKRYRSYQGHLGRVAPNVLARGFQSGCPNQKWVTDVTEFNVSGQKVYLSPILDLYNGEIVSYAVATRPHLEMVMRMLQRACRRLGSQDAPLLHSDQGWQYQMPAYQTALKARGLLQNMSRKGNCLDNAVMENFFGILKSEFFHKQKFNSVSSFIRQLKAYIHYYNHDRIKQKLKGLSPVEYRTQSFSLN